MLVALCCSNKRTRKRWLPERGGFIGATALLEAYNSMLEREGGLLSNALPPKRKLYR